MSKNFLIMFDGALIFIWVMIGILNTITSLKFKEGVKLSSYLMLLCIFILEMFSKIALEVANL